MIITSFYQDDLTQPPPSLTGKLEDKRVVVITKGLNGLACANKIAHYCLNRLGAKNIALAVPDKRVPEETYIGEEITILDATFLSVREWNPTIQILVPAESSFVRSFILTKDIPTLAIAEFGFDRPNDLDEFPNVRAYSIGIEKGALGILIDHEFHKKRVDAKEAFSELPLMLQMAISNPQGKFYFGCAHYPQEIANFIYAVVKMNVHLEESSDLCFYFMGKADLLFSLRQDIGFQQNLKSCKISCVEFCHYLDLNSIHTEILDPSLNKKVRIITGMISSQFVPLLQMASEYEKLGTGDLFSQLLTEGVFPVYETYSHPEKLLSQFWDALPLQMRELVNFYDHQKSDRLSLTLNADKLADFFIQRRTNPGTHEMIQNALDSIISRYDFGPRFEEAIGSLMTQTASLDRRSIPTLVLPTEKQIKSKDFPFEIEVYLPHQEMLKLQMINHKLSEHPAFADSSFTYTSVGTGYLCIRHKI